MRDKSNGSKNGEEGWGDLFVSVSDYKVWGLEWNALGLPGQSPTSFS